jgi:phospho-N-acetylmuramoyl-pentapeptide-transferase
LLTAFFLGCFASVKFPAASVFLVAPVHHHFEAIGWSRYKITMRYWVLSLMFAVIGIIIAMIG